jgi:signal transduction histidine kinase
MSADHPKREQTDESLRVERDKADAKVGVKREAVEDEADEVVRLARERADEVVRTARDGADRERPPHSTATAASVQRERTRADVALEHERSDADKVIEHERAQRKRYLVDFLTVERDATDKDLVGERAYADGVIAARDEFLATVSHDLRSLLNSLSLNAGLLTQQAPEGASGDRTRKHAATSLRLIARMNRLIGDLLDVASIEAGKLGTVPEQVEVAKLVGDTVEAFAPIAAARGVTLTTDATLALDARMDGSRILQVLANLVSNAIKFTPPGGRVSLRIVLEERELRFTVSDSGIGIAEDALQAVFERFRQVTPDRRGLGLGLHISKSIVEAHGGRMWAESRLGVGSTFHFALPHKSGS